MGAFFVFIYVDTISPDIKLFSHIFFVGQLPLVFPALPAVLAKPALHPPCSS